MKKILLFCLVFSLSLMAQTEFLQLTSAELKAGKFKLKKVSITEKITRGILLAQEKEIDVTYIFHYPEKIIQLPPFDDSFNHATNPIAALYTSKAFGLEKEYEESRSDVEDGDKKLAILTKKIGGVPSWGARLIRVSLLIFNLVCFFDSSNSPLKLI